MSKLIYVDRLKRDILALHDCYNGFSDTYDKACIIGVIDEQPTVEERKTGRWTTGVCGEPICSECGISLENEALEVDPFSYNYCPWCGVRMEQPEKNKEKLLPHKKEVREELVEVSRVRTEMEEDNGN